MHYTRVHAKYPTWEACTIMQQQKSISIGMLLWISHLNQSEVLQMLEMLDASKMPLM